jgi:hypothetical protein
VLQLCLCCKAFFDVAQFRSNIDFYSNTSYVSITSSMKKIQM